MPFCSALQGPAKEPLSLSWRRRCRRRCRFPPIITDNCTQNRTEHRFVNLPRVEQECEDTNHNDGEHIAEPDCTDYVLEGQLHASAIAVVVYVAGASRPMGTVHARSLQIGTHGLRLMYSVLCIPYYAFYSHILRSCACGLFCWTSLQASSSGIPTLLCR